MQATKEFLIQDPDTFCFYPFHPNPQVIHAIEQTNVSELKNLYLCEPLPYGEMVNLICQADLVLTDSGGIQEEAISLGKHVLILREKTERVEGVWAGLATIVGTDKHTIHRTLGA